MVSAHPTRLRRTRVLRSPLSAGRPSLLTSPLSSSQAIAGRLYTGPCYEKYNAALRYHSNVPYLMERFKELCKGNAYPTTIHAINSSVATDLNPAALCPIVSLPRPPHPFQKRQPDRLGNPFHDECF